MWGLKTGSDGCKSAWSSAKSFHRKLWHIWQFFPGRRDTHEFEKTYRSVEVWRVQRDAEAVCVTCASLQMHGGIKHAQTNGHILTGAYLISYSRIWKGLKVRGQWILRVCAPTNARKGSHIHQDKHISIYFPAYIDTHVVPDPISLVW